LNHHWNPSYRRWIPNFRHWNPSYRRWIPNDDRHWNPSYRRWIPSFRHWNPSYHRWNPNCHHCYPRDSGDANRLRLVERRRRPRS
jgi:hypothetical protein